MSEYLDQILQKYLKTKPDDEYLDFVIMDELDRALKKEYEDEVGK